MTASIRAVGLGLGVQCAVTQLLSIAFFLHTPAGIIGGMMAPWMGFVVAWVAFMHRGSSLEVLVSGFIAVFLLTASLILWLRYRQRIGAHVTLALFSILSMAMLLGAI